MIITKMALPRRTFLRGIGATVALPLLDAMVPALRAMAKTPANPVSRLVFVYLPNGVAMNHTGVNHWKPTGEGSSFELSPILTPLAPFRDQLVVVSGLTHSQAQSLGDGNGDHTRGTATRLSGVKPKKTEGSDLKAGTTADQIAAETLGKDTALPSLELGAIDVDNLVGNCENGYSCAYMNALAWRTPTTPLPTVNNPRIVFERLFGDGGSAAQRLSRMREDRSLLDSVTGEIARLQPTLGPSDRATVGEYFDAVREVEQRIQKAEKNSSDSTLPAVLERPLGIPESFSEHVTLMFDLQRLAYQADITRVCTFMTGREVNIRTFPEIGITEAHHALSHHGDKPDAIAKLVKINTLQTQLFASFLEKLRATPDGDGSLLDHMMLLYGAGLSNANIHSHIDLPLLVVGGATGRLKGGRHVVYREETPMTNLLLSILDKAGVSLDHLGDSSGRVEPLSGV
jgi:hypothetical protein